VLESGWPGTALVGSGQARAILARSSCLASALSRAACRPPRTGPGCQEYDRTFERAAGVSQLVRGQLPPGMRRLFYCGGLVGLGGGWHWSALLTGHLGFGAGLPLRCLRAFMERRGTWIRLRRSFASPAPGSGFSSKLTTTTGLAGARYSSMASAWLAVVGSVPNVDASSRPDPTSQLPRVPPVRAKDANEIPGRRQEPG
jgi:hypothetical protein